MEKKYAQIAGEFFAKLQDADPAVVGCLARLIFADTDYDGVIKTTARDLKVIVGYSDYGAINRVLGALADNGIISVAKNGSGTTITLAEVISVDPVAPTQAAGPADTVRETRTDLFGKAEQSVRESRTPSPFPQTPYPAKDSFINKQQDNIKKNIKGAKQGELFLDPNAGTFRAEGKTPLQRYGNWYVENYLPAKFKSATRASTEQWYKSYGKMVSEILKLADNNAGIAPLDMSKRVTVRVAAQMERAAKNNASIEAWGLPSVIKNFDTHSEVIVDEQRKAEILEAKREGAI